LGRDSGLVDSVLEGVFERSPGFGEDPVVRRKLAAAARLSGPQRYLTYGQLDLDIARNAAPWIAYATPPLHEFFAARVGCQTYGVYGLDLAALCIRDPTRQ
jgi:hypothetical protein